MASKAIKWDQQMHKAESIHEQNTLMAPPSGSSSYAFLRLVNEKLASLQLQVFHPVELLIKDRNMSVRVADGAILQQAQSLISSK